MSPLPISPPKPEPDDDLLDDLMAQLDSKDPNVQTESAQVLNEMQSTQMTQARENSAGKRQDSRARYQARQARKAESLAQNHPPTDPAADARIEQETRDEEATIKKICEELHLELHEINPNGHCLFAAIADQLSLLGILPPAQATYVKTRFVASHYIYTHPDDFLPFLPSIDGEDGIGATDPGLMTPKQFEIYCASIRDTSVWGGEPEILALCRAFNVPIHIIQGGHPPVVVHTPQGQPTEKAYLDKHVVRISYHKRMYGLGEHYNSLWPKQSLIKSLLG